MIRRMAMQEQSIITMLRMTAEGVIRRKIMRIVKKYWLPLALVLAIDQAVWRIGYLERTNTSLSMEIGREALCRTESRSR